MREAPRVGTIRDLRAEERPELGAGALSVPQPMVQERVEARVPEPLVRVRLARRARVARRARLDPVPSEERGDARRERCVRHGTP